jgi:O-antigen biosynthesis protein WbqP
MKHGYLNLKRVLDVILSSAALVLLSPLILIIACCILIFDRSPTLYWSDRIGINSQIFKMPKFRTMRLGTPEVATDLLNSPHIHLTCLGPFLRKSSLDELPQLWSILIGDMSFVGPRPALFNQTELITKRRNGGVDLLRPGLTGLAQVSGRDGLSIDQKVQFDGEYMKNISLTLDIKIIAMTFTKVFLGKNVSH